MSATAAVGGNSSIYNQLIQSLSGAGSTGSTSSLSTILGISGGTGQSSASISGPGQLLSNLEKLQTQNPTAFKQVVTQIASQLQTAAQQAGQTPKGQFLSSLAQKFQNVANGGSLSQLQPSQQHHHHRGHEAYSANGQNSDQGLTGLTQTSSSSPSSGPNMQQLFTTISNEVTQALAS